MLAGVLDVDGCRIQAHRDARGAEILDLLLSPSQQSVTN
jgi:hypothetical protein